MNVNDLYNEWYKTDTHFPNRLMIQKFGPNNRLLAYHLNPSHKLLAKDRDRAHAAHLIFLYSAQLVYIQNK